MQILVKVLITYGMNVCRLCLNIHCDLHFVYLSWSPRLRTILSRLFTVDRWLFVVEVSWIHIACCVYLVELAVTVMRCRILHSAPAASPARWRLTFYNGHDLA